MEKEIAINKLTSLKERLYGKYDCNGNRISMGIIPWIKEHPEVTEPNMYEIVSCWCEFGEGLSALNEYYLTTGYPLLEDGKESCHYETWKTTEVSRACRDGLVEMENLRNLNNHEFAQSEVAQDFLEELKYRVFASEYDVPRNPSIAELKKEVLCKSMSIPFYIWQVQRTNPNYRYDNIVEWQSVQEAYQMYKDFVGPQYGITFMEVQPKYEGPQFGDVIEKAFASVEENYMYKDAPKTFVKK